MICGDARAHVAAALAIVPCGRKKVWDHHPTLGAVAARDAYTGSAFRLNRAYAERFAGHWIILSAKHGFVAPDTLLPGPYDVTFKDCRTGTVTMDALWQQVVTDDLAKFQTVISLGGTTYRMRVEAAFAPHGAAVLAPFAGLSIGRYLQAVRRSLDSGDPFPSSLNCTRLAELPCDRGGV